MHILSAVMPGLGPGIHELRRKMVTRSRGDRGVALSPRSPRLRVINSWMPSPRLGMTSGTRMERALQPPGLDDALEEGAGALLLGVAEDLLGRAFLVDHAAIEEADLARDVAGEAHLVGGEQHGH